MEEIIDRLYENGIYVNLATPSGARPQLAGGQISGGAAGGRVQKETDIRGCVHNACFTSPAYRMKVISDQQKAGRAV